VDPSSSSLPATAAPPLVVPPSTLPATAHLARPALPQAPPPPVRHRPRDPSNSGKWLHLLWHRHAPIPNPKILCFHRICRCQPRCQRLRGAPWPRRRKKRYALIFLYADYSILAFSHIVISCCGLIYMVVSFEKSILFVLCFVNILPLILYDVLFQHLIRTRLFLCFFFISMFKAMNDSSLEALRRGLCIAYRRCC
jgi:hypothetical protein